MPGCRGDVKPLQDISNPEGYMMPDGNGNVQIRKDFSRACSHKGLGV